ncbi:hypothetical protein VTH82DRAFT_5932 [Thermothelomyces myriococcoides]
MTAGELPPELLCQVFDELDHAPPSEHRLKDEPGPNMLRDSNCPLQTASLVSKKWRAVVLPLLFRHVVWYLASCNQLHSRPDEDSESQADDPSESSSFLAFLRANDLACRVRSLTIVVFHNEGTDSGDHSLSEYNLEKRERTRLNSINNTQEQYAVENGSIIVYYGDNNWLWRMLFAVMNPSTLTSLVLVLH